MFILVYIYVIVKYLFREVYFANYHSLISIIHYRKSGSLAANNKSIICVAHTISSGYFCRTKTILLYNDWRVIWYLPENQSFF